jgi:hypothetical protein
VKDNFSGAGVLNFSRTTFAAVGKLFITGNNVNQMSKFLYSN